MAVERKTYTYTPFAYDTYQESDEVTTAKTNKTNAESAVANYGDYVESDVVKGAYNNKTNAENALANYGDFSYSKSDMFNQIMDKILNREKFSYDVNGDALYQQYKDKYIQQGKMAMADTMGQAAAMTGGYGNSYAASVGNQAYQASLQNLNDVIPQLYQMAYDRYNQEGQDLYNQYGMLSDDRSTEYGMWGDKRNMLAADRDYYANDYNNAFNRDYGMWGDKYNMLVGERDYYGNEYNNAFNRDYGMYSADRDIAHGEHTTSEGYKYQDVADANAFAQWKANYDLSVEQANKSSSGSGGGNGSGGSGGGGTFTNTLWTATGTTDDNGNPVYRSSDGKTQAFGAGINPYTGTKHSDAKHGTFSNGYQPNNIGGTKLKNSGMSTNVTGKNQTIWEANGKYWLWRGDLNRYIEVDVSDLD
jgi:hypothetical protein